MKRRKNTHRQRNIKRLNVCVNVCERQRERERQVRKKYFQSCTFLVEKKKSLKNFSGIICLWRNDSDCRKLY